MPKNKFPDKLQIWIEARKRFHLLDSQVQMARELGMNPRNFVSLNNQRQEKWKLSLPQFIESLYFKRFKKSQPDRVISIEERVNEIAQKKAAKQERKIAAEK
jgi:hypothetical protein